jgi:UDP-2,4-diacetamido-2,4,6-trideoxy-beta-L-altropyranose hydrolase
LATILKDEFLTSFYLKEPEQTIIKILTDKGFEVIVIRDEETFIRNIGVKDIVVLDGYHFDNSYQKKIKSSDAILVCIDDLHDKPFVADVIINHAPGVSKESYQAEVNTEFLLGPEYALLRVGFQQQAKVSRKIDRTENALVCFGGSDAKNLTIHVLRILLNYSDFKSITVITGTAYHYTKDLLEVISSTTNVTHHHNIGEEEIIKILLSVELAIVPASGILFEVIACKTPAISGYYIDNQLDNYNGFFQRGVFYDAGDFASEKLRSAIEEALNSNPNKIVKNQAACIDGKSANRYVDIFKKFRYGHPSTC